MKKKMKTKTAKRELPDLVMAMTKLVERLEILEKKTDQVLGRVGNFPTEIRRAIQELPRPQASYSSQPASRPEQGSQQSHGQRERILYQAVCADCQKRCEVPFRPSGDRPVYCPECFAIRKAGHAPKDLTSHIVVPPHVKALKTAPPAENKAATASKRKKAKPSPGKGVKKKKK